MASIGNISAKLTLNTRAFEMAAGTAKRTAAGLRNGIASVARSLTSLPAALGGAAAIGGAIAGWLQLRNVMEDVDKTAKLSDSLGITTEALTGLRHAAGLAGVDAEAFDKSLKKMVVSIGEAAASSGDQAQAFSAIGLDAGKLAAMEPDQAFAKIADALNKLPTPAARAAAAVRIFGKEGVNLIPTLALGSEGLATNREEAEKLGLTFSRIDAAKIELANDSITRMQSVVKGAGQSLAIELAPFIEAAATKLVALATEGDGVGKKVTSAFETVLRVVARIADYGQLAKAWFTTLRLEANALLWALAKVGQGIEWAAAKVTGAKFDPSNSFFAQFSAELEKEMANNVATIQDAGLAFLDGSSEKAVTKFFEDLRTNATTAAAAIAAAGAKSRGVFDDAVSDADVAKLTKAQQTIAGLEQELERLTLSRTDQVLKALVGEGASSEELQRAYDLVKRIEETQQSQDRQKNVAGTLEELQSRVETFGKTEREITLRQLEANAAGDDQLQQARDLFDQLDALEADKAARERKPEANTLIESNSAQAQRLAYLASKGINQPKDETPKRQLDTQLRMARSLESIDSSLRDAGDTSWELN